jgi:hypothetical protein|tara:strand:- start:2340 stop:2462 length:123 start_codon:yes stop_codon:yes gene_type:complete
MLLGDKRAEVDMQLLINTPLKGKRIKQTKEGSKKKEKNVL